MARPATQVKAPSKEKGVSSPRSHQPQEEDAQDRPAFEMIAEQVRDKFKFGKQHSADAIARQVNSSISRGASFRAKGKFTLVRLEKHPDGLDQLGFRIATSGDHHRVPQPVYHPANLFRK